jgi:hypothetical protein
VRGMFRLIDRSAIPRKRSRCGAAGAGSFPRLAAGRSYIMM